MGKQPFSSVKRKAVKFRLQDVAAALIKLADVHEGLWQVQVVFSHSATNINLNGQFVPASITSVMGLQLGMVEQEDALTVDAAKVNPASRIVVPGGGLLH